MIWLRSCPRCHGDLTLESDIYGRYLSCLQCGGEIEETEIRRLARISMPPRSVRSGYTEAVHVRRGAKGQRSARGEPVRQARPLQYAVGQFVDRHNSGKGGNRCYAV